jgi:hypothetical protein
MGRHGPNLAQNGKRDELLWTQQRTFRFHKLRGISRLAEELLAPQDVLFSKEIVKTVERHVASYFAKLILNKSFPFLQNKYLGWNHTYSK